MELVSRAIEFATRAHDGMVRKGEQIPYILHPMEAAAIVGTMTADQEVIAAAVLHDVVEDTPVCAEEVAREFGPVITELVLSETEDKRDGLPADQTWQIRKQEAVEALEKTADIRVKMLYIGDKLSNIRSMERGICANGADEWWQKFNQKDPQMHKWYYRSIAEATRELSHTQAWQEYDRLITKIFGE